MVKNNSMQDVKNNGEKLLISDFRRLQGDVESNIIMPHELI
jgi:hypothetical protein